MTIRHLRFNNSKILIIIRIVLSTSNVPGSGAWGEVYCAQLHLFWPTRYDKAVNLKLVLYEQA